MRAPPVRRLSSGLGRAHDAQHLEQTDQSPVVADRIRLLCGGPLFATRKEANPMLFRTTVSADASAIGRLHRDLSDHDRYMRFFAIHPAGLDKLASSLAVCDDAHFAVGAFDGTRCVGVANFVVSPGTTTADIAIAVATDYHHRGIGTELLQRITSEAIKRDITRFEADILAENSEIHQLLRSEPWELDYQHDGSCTHISANLKAPRARASLQGDVKEP